MYISLSFLHRQDSIYEANGAGHNYGSNRMLRTSYTCRYIICMIPIRVYSVYSIIYYTLCTYSIIYYYTFIYYCTLYTTLLNILYNILYTHSVTTAGPYSYPSGHIG